MIPQRHNVTVGEVIDILKAETERRGLMFQAGYGDTGAPGETFTVSATDLDEMGSFSMAVAGTEYALCLRVFTAALVEWKGAARS